MTFDPEYLNERLELVGGHKRTTALDIIAAVKKAPAVTQTIDAASTLELVCGDAKRTLLRSPLLNQRSWVVLGKGRQAIHFELVSVGKSGDEITLTFEDAIVAALRRRKDPMSVPANSTTRPQLVKRIAREANVDVIVDDSDKERIHNALARSARGEEKTDSWEWLGTSIAEPRHWRRFSTGRELMVGPDEWLLDRDPAVTVVRENTGPFGALDFDLDVGARVNEATLTVDIGQWALPPGSAVEAKDAGAADGKWLVAEIPWSIGTTRAAVKLVRPTRELAEPKRERNAHPREQGDSDFLPGKDGSDGGGAASTPARERMVRWALAQRGKAYAWGGNGPDGFDCSGLVQEATRAAGRALPKPSASQWAAVQRAGKTCPVSTAIATRGALLFRIGVGTYNHVAISLGNGSTIEALGTGYGVNVFKAAGRTWTGAGFWL